ncbi:hypothetical protein ACCS72_38400, partial [Rhizobium ruizarguesonis]
NRPGKSCVIGGHGPIRILPDDDVTLLGAKKKTDFVGIRGLKRPDLVKDGRKQLVGLVTKDPKLVLEEGAQIVASPNEPKP